MSADFDPYHKWLSIPPREQPPNHYRLLGTGVFESDREVIDAAANRQMTYLKALAVGKNVKHVQKLLKEVAAARLCLLDPQERAAYDALLKAKAGAAKAGAAKAGAAKTASVRAGAARPQPKNPNTAAQRARRPQPREAAQDSEPGFPVVATAQSLPATSRDSTPPPKSSIMMPVVAMFCAALIVFAIAIAILVMRQRGPAPAVAGVEEVEYTPDAGGEPSGDKAQADVDTPANDQRGKGDQKADPAAPDPETKSKQPAPKSPPDPSVEQPKQDPAQDANTKPEKPESIAKAHAALEQKDIPDVIFHLDAYLSGDPQPPWQAEAKDLLAQARLAVSVDEAQEYVVAEANNLSDEEAAQIVDGKKAFELVATPKIKHPILREVFVETARRHVQVAVQERHRRGQDAVAQVDDPKQTEPDTGGTEPATPLARPDNPADLLASEGIEKEGSRWILAQREMLLKEELQKVSALFKQLNDGRRAITISNRQQLALAIRKVTEEEGKIRKRFQEFQKQGSVLKTEYEKATKIQAEISAKREKVDAAKSKVDQHDDQLLKTREELAAAIEKMEETVNDLSETYDRLLNDEEIIAAVEAQGSGSFAPSSSLKTATLKLKRMQAALAKPEVTGLPFLNQPGGAKK